jgi:hypothetical protein
MSSPYYLGIDVRRGTITAAVVEGSRRDAIITQGVQLESGYAMPAAIHIRPDELAFGEEALARGLVEPERLISDFVADLDQSDAVFLVDGEEFAAADLYAWAVDNVAARVASMRGARPAGIWVAVPAWWDDARIDAVADAFDRDGRIDPEFITAPEALARRYSEVDPSNPDLTVIVCDVDDRALQAVIVRQVPGTQKRRVGAPVHAPISADSSDRAIDEHAIDTVVAALADTGVAIEAVTAIVLSGPPDRLEQFRGLLVERFGEPIEVDPDPEWATAAGAALALARQQFAAQAAAAQAAAAAAARAAATGAAVAVAGAATVAGGAGRAVTPTTGATPRPPWYRRPARLAGIGVAAAAIVIAGAVASAFAIGGTAPSATETDSPSSTVASPGPATGPAAPSASPSATPMPTADAVAPPTAPDSAAPDSAVPESPRVRANPRIPSATAPRTPTTTPPTVAAPSNPQPPAAPPASGPEPTTEPEPTTGPEPTPDPTTEPEPEPTTPPDPPVDPTPEPDPTFVEPSPSSAPAPDESAPVTP